MAKLVGPLILTFILAGPCVAAAESAWVLWEHRIQLGGKGGAIDEWSILDIYDSRGPKGGAR